jgi:hypothetical protein
MVALRIRAYFTDVLCCIIKANRAKVNLFFDVDNCIGKTFSLLLISFQQIVSYSLGRFRPNAR